MDRNQVVLVDSSDISIGVMDKLEAHQRGMLHRAFSIFIFNSHGDMLIHQRAADKYHGANLWTNACCSHPQLQEQVLESAQERLWYEMGMHCPIAHIFSFIYRAEVEHGLVEHELDHVFIGYTDDIPVPNPAEVQAYRWIAIDDLKTEIAEYPERFTIWFRTCVADVLTHCK